MGLSTLVRIRHKSQCPLPHRSQSELSIRIGIKIGKTLFIVTVAVACGRIFFTLLKVPIRLTHIDRLGDYLRLINVIAGSDLKPPTSHSTPEPHRFLLMISR